MRVTKFLYVCAVSAIFLWCPGRHCVAQEVDQGTAKPEWRVFTQTGLSGSDCTPAENAGDEESRICKGVEGYSLLLRGDKLKPEIDLVAPNGRRYPLKYWDTSDPKFVELRDSAMWTVVNLKKTTIEIEFRVETKPRQDYTQIGSYEVIARVAPGPVCIVSSVAAGPQADSASITTSGRCLRLHEREKRDWFLTASRLAGEGQISAAKRAVTKLHRPSERFMIYHNIASSQFKAGDTAGALRTLMGARAEALRNPFRGDRIYTLIHVVAGLTESGFYESAKSNIKLFSKSDRLRMYLMVAAMQGEKKDFEAAKKTFREAMQLVPQGSQRAEGNLQEIGIAQANMGLVDEARKSASMIRNPELRLVVEQRISENSRPD